ncbi:putative transporter small subunit [Pollutimonas nitritireducens]|nr:putative transporter small subunit [Pollutimonas nitritireducens]
MSALVLTTYILIWPVISAAVLLVLIVALIKDLRAAGKDGESMI